MHSALMNCTTKGVGFSVENVLFEVRDGVGFITLDRPEAMNAMNSALLGDLSEVLRNCRGDQTVRVLVIKGNGRAFCAGGDVRWMQETQADSSWPAQFHSLVGQLNQVIMLIRNMPKPVIAAVHGFASGAGFSLALACDLRLATEGARFNQAYVNLSLTPDGGSTYFLSLLLGPAKALELIYTGRMVDAQEALALGLLNEVVPEESLAAKAAELAAKLAQGPAIAYGQAKKLVYEAHRQSLAEQLELEQESIVSSSLSRDFREGLAAFAEKRKPLFQGK